MEGGGRPPDDLHDATELALAPDANAALPRLSAEAGAALPAGFTATSAHELLTRSCVLKRVLTFTSPGRGRVVFAWEQLASARSRHRALYEFENRWEDRADGGVVGVEAPMVDYQAVRVVVGDGRMLRVSARGTSYRSSGWPTTKPPSTGQPMPRSPAPLSVDQLRPIAERLATADQR